MLSWDCCWGCSCSAIVDASGAASSVLFVGSILPVCCVAAVWVSFKFVFVFQDSCVCYQWESSVWVSLCQHCHCHWAVQQVQVVRPEQQCVHMLNSHEIPALRQNRDFNIAIAKRQCEAMQISIHITEICSCDTHLCSSRNYHHSRILDHLCRIFAFLQKNAIFT